MKLDQNIKDALRATVIVMALAALVVAAIQAYVSLSTDENQQINRFLTMASNLHDDIDGNLVYQDVLGLVETVSAERIENTREVELAISHGAFLTKSYRERFYSLVSITDDTLALKNSLVQEGEFLLSCYNCLRSALRGKTDQDSDAFSVNIQKTRQNLDEAMTLRSQNQAELERWINEIDTD